LRELGIKSVDISVRDIDDPSLLRIMANENLDSWGMSPSVINETIFAAKKFLEEELARCESLDHPGELSSVILSSNSQFQQCKRDGVGRDTIKKFLGGNWTEHMVQEALSVHKSIEKAKDTVWPDLSWRL
jgi:hypothetical protein